jgi:hypothetical protein
MTNDDKETAEKLIILGSRVRLPRHRVVLQIL